MLTSKKITIKDTIINNLRNGEVDTLILLDKIKKEINITKQGFYKAIRELIADEIIIKNKMSIFLSPLWIKKLEEFVNDLTHKNKALFKEKILNIEEGDSITFRFKSISELYLLWFHYFILFCNQSEGNVIFYNKYNIWATLRSDIENEIYSWLKQNNKETYAVAGNKTLIEKEVGLFMKEKYNIQTSYGEIKNIQSNHFPAVFGDYVMTTILDKNTLSKIAKAYEENKNLSKDFENQIEKIIENMKNPKITIEKKKIKAERIRKNLMSHFIFYKNPKA